ncbi:MAG TPA: alkane 1-monooxygenase [Ramlibacter sp.]
MENAFRRSDLRFVAGLLLPLALAFNMLVHPEHAAIGAFIIWAAVALLDLVWRRSPGPGGSSEAMLWILRVYVPVQGVLLAVGLWACAHASWPVVIGLAYGAGFLTGAQGITYAHELGHGRRKADRVLGWVLMTSVNYPQFMVEHYRGHHVRVATRDDPASARSGESLWAFLPRTVIGSTLHAWQLHKQRWSPLALAWAFNLVFVAALIALGQWKALAFWVGQSAFAVWLLETVNYIEHYGLERAVLANGQREPFGVAHAWNADHPASNSLLANLQRHSDHHMHAWKPYAQLEALPGPQLPTGYAGCLLLAAIPPLWFHVMDARAPAVPASP